MHPSPRTRSLACLLARRLGRGPGTPTPTRSLSSSAQSRESAHAPSLRAGAHWFLSPVCNYDKDEAGGLLRTSPDPERNYVTPKVPLSLSLSCLLASRAFGAWGSPHYPCASLSLSLSLYRDRRGGRTLTVRVSLSLSLLQCSQGKARSPPRARTRTGDSVRTPAKEEKRPFSSNSFTPNLLMNTNYPPAVPLPRF